MTRICNLPIDTKFDILSRLLVKDLCKFRCVSKHWCNLISNPKFIHFYHERSTENPQILLMNDSKSDENQQLIHFASMDFDGNVGNELMKHINGDYIDMLPCGHGLICFVYENPFYIYNPATQEFVSLIKGSPSPYDDHGAGFGYVTSTEEYKVIHMFTQSESTINGFKTGCELLTLSNGDEASSRYWKVIDQCCPYPVSDCALLVNNVFYWTRADKHDSSSDYELILALDLGKENFKTIDLPEPNSYDEENYMFLVEFRGFLCLVDNFAIPPIMNIWMLKDAKNMKWVKEYSIRFDILDGFDDVYTIVTPLLYRNGEILVDSDQDSLH